MTHRWLKIDNKSVKEVNPLSANPTKWSKTLKQFLGNLPTNCLSMFDHFMKLALKGLIQVISIYVNSFILIFTCTYMKSGRNLHLLWLIKISAITDDKPLFETLKCLKYLVFKTRIHFDLCKSIYEATILHFHCDFTPRFWDNLLLISVLLLKKKNIVKSRGYFFMRPHLLMKLFEKMVPHWFSGESNMPP